MYRFTIKGVVQGVGFRPYIYNACTKEGLCGSVQNTGDGVVVEVNDKEAFIKVLEKIPENSRVDSYEIEEVDSDHSTFTILKSEGRGYAEIPPDFYLCKDCQAELLEEDNRRFGYFFTTCTNCGPRFSITKNAPYDRDTTSMKMFEMCCECKGEYEDPEDRRYHAQTIACINCGPKLTLYKNKDAVSGDAIKNTVELIKKGELVSIKGIGGFHIVCNTKDKTIEKLKRLTGRRDKPFALMCRDIEMAKIISRPSEIQKELLINKERPIVLIEKKENVGNAVTELDTVGIMLPYSALHYLLFAHIDEPIVMTSSNLSDEPISTTKEEQKTEYILDHDREIINAVDDSVAKVIGDRYFFIRKSRGYVPRSIEAPKGDHNILAVGAELSNSFALYNKEGRITLSQYMGTTSNLNTLERYKKAVHAFLKYTDVEPDLIVSDLHPEYNTTHFAETLSEELQIPLLQVQHHKAHAYGVALENGLDDFTAIVSDGLGYGEDRTIWGGEIFCKNERVGHLEQQYQLGGDSASRFPAKMLFSILRRFLSLEETKKFLHQYFNDRTLSLLDKQLSERYNAPLTSSTGRILDAVSFMLGFCDERTYDGRPAMMLEASSGVPYEIEPVIENDILLTTPLFEYLVKNMNKDKRRLAATSELYIAKGLFEIAKGFKKPIVWSGGVAYNTIMTEYMLRNNVHTHKEIPPGDGGISFGQIAYLLADPGNYLAPWH